MRAWGRLATVLALIWFAPVPLQAQGTGVTLGGLESVRGLPIEIVADDLQVDNTTGETLFRGNAVLGQGDMRLAAESIRIVFSTGDEQRIRRLEASGGVTLVTSEEAAEARDVDYDVDSGTVNMRGSVILTQGPNVLSGDVFRFDLDTGQGRMEGNVRTIIQSGDP